MPSKSRAPSGSGEVRTKLERIVSSLSYNRRALSRELGISYYRSRQIVNAVQEKKPVREFIGTGRQGEKRLAFYQEKLEQSGYKFREQRVGGRRRIAAIPPEPTKGRRAKRQNRKEFQNATRDWYRYEPGKKIVIPKGAMIQIFAKGRGKSKGKSIKQIASNVGNWESAWATFNEMSRRTGFVARRIDVIVITPK